MIEPASFHDGRVQLYVGDCLEVLDQLPEASIDSACMDPPYHLSSVVKRFGAENAAPAQQGTDGLYARASRGFMGQQWDGGNIAFRVETWAKVLRVLKPGGHLVAFSGSRTYARMAVAVEDAGFEIRDMIGWLYGAGFPKSHDVALDFEISLCERIAGKWIYRSDGAEMVRGQWRHPQAVEWEGWGTALKPGLEPICFARKPLIGTVAANVLQFGTGSLNIEGCRIGEAVVGWGGARGGSDDDTQSGGRNYRLAAGAPRHAIGRWPANVVHDGSAEVIHAFPESAGQQGDVSGNEPSSLTNNVYGKFNGRPATGARGDTGSAARFFYSAKADADDRIGSKHPTVKPVELMRWLVRLVTPPGGTVLDPFAGTGPTGAAAFYEGFKSILIEREPEYAADIIRRIGLLMAGPDERRAKIVPQETEEALPLFGGAA